MAAVPGGMTGNVVPLPARLGSPRGALGAPPEAAWNAETPRSRKDGALTPHFQGLIVSRKCSLKPGESTGEAGSLQERATVVLRALSLLAAISGGIPQHRVSYYRHPSAAIRACCLPALSSCN